MLKWLSGIPGLIQVQQNGMESLIESCSDRTPVISYTFLVTELLLVD